MASAVTITSFEGFELDVKEYEYLRPGGNSQEDDGEYAYALASFTVDTTGTYSVDNIGFHNVLYVGTDNDYTANESYTFIGLNTPDWKADTMLYVYDEEPNLTTPSNTSSLKPSGPVGISGKLKEPAVIPTENMGIPFSLHLEICSSFPEDTRAMILTCLFSNSFFTKPLNGNSALGT